MQPTRHRSAEMLRRYIRDGELLSTANAARFTGLCAAQPGEDLGANSFVLGVPRDPSFPGRA
jgi:hypothetical protein